MLIKKKKKKINERMNSENSEGPTAGLWNQDSSTGW